VVRLRSASPESSTSYVTYGRDLGGERQYARGPSRGGLVTPSATNPPRGLRWAECRLDERNATHGKAAMSGRSAERPSPSVPGPTARRATALPQATSNCFSDL